MYLRLDQLTKGFGGGKGRATALDSVCMDFAEGEFVAVLGPSGCGKTTLLQVIAGIERPDGGRLLLKGRDITLLAPERRNFGMVFQNYALFPNLTVAENIRYGLHGPGWDKHSAAKRCAELLALTDLADLASRYPAQLSGGQQQRVALARALAPRPALLLLDEPLSALDAQVRLALGQELRRIQRQTGVTALMVTHDQHEALSLADRIVLMRQGRVLRSGTPDELYDEPGSRFGAEFIGRMNLLAPPGSEDGALCGMRFEDVQVLPASEMTLRREQTFVARIEHSALMGAFYRFELLLNDFSTRLHADVPRAEGARLLRGGGIVAVHLPPERWHMFSSEGD